MFISSKSTYSVLKIPRTTHKLAKRNSSKRISQHVFYFETGIIHMKEKTHCTVLALTSDL